MPIVNVPDTCVGCGACCTDLNVLAAGGDVPASMVEERDKALCMKRRTDGMCVALDPETRRCTIYDRRPEICREFPPNSQQCLDALHKFQQNAMRAEALAVEQGVKSAVDSALAWGFAPEVRFTNLLKQEYVVYLRRATMSPDVRVEARRLARLRLYGTKTGRV